MMLTEGNSVVLFIADIIKVSHKHTFSIDFPRFIIVIVS